jgi:predicted acyltransferase
VIKTLWTSSYVLVAGGYSLLLLGLAHCVGEIWRVGGALKVFVWIGANAIALYLLEGVIGFSKLAERLLGSEITMRLDAMRPGAAATANAVLGLTLVICLARFLYARRLFLRV